MKKKLSLLYLAIFIVVIGTCSAKKKKKFPTENNIIVMNDGNFEKVIQTYKNVLVYFYVPFCSHSAQLTSTF